MSQPLRRMFVIVGALALAAASCGRDSGVLVAGSWQGGAADALRIESRVQGGDLATQSFPGPLASPYRVLVHSPPGATVEIRMSALRSDQPFAVGALGVTPGDNEILQVALELQPTTTTTTTQ